MIYFNENGQACAFEIENPLATVEKDVWKLHSRHERGTTWDIKDGEFVQLVDIERMQAKADARGRISELKEKLMQTDYQAIKYSEGTLSEEEYADMKAQRQAWRDEINELESL